MHQINEVLMKFKGINLNNLALRGVMKALNKCDTKKVNLSKVKELVLHQEDAAFCTGDVFYYHYGCDSIDDRGWGCGYRTLQSLCSWANDYNNRLVVSSNTSCTISSVPSIDQIQTALVGIGDKPANFFHSKQWIGSIEICLCLDVFYNMPCKIIHVKDSNELQQYVSQIFEHFVTIGAPLMMGGETDNSSKGIIGVQLKNPAFLIADPHYFGCDKSAEELIDLGYIRWVPISDLHSNSFYNLCIPYPCTK